MGVDKVDKLSLAGFGQGKSEKYEACVELSLFIALYAYNTVVCWQVVHDQDMTRKSYHVSERSSLRALELTWLSKKKLHTLKHAFLSDSAQSRIGSGTGLFTRALLNHPDWQTSLAALHAIEPNEGMRNVFHGTISDPRVTLTDGVFERTGVEDMWADMIVMAAVSMHIVYFSEVLISTFLRRFIGVSTMKLQSWSFHGYSSLAEWSLLLVTMLTRSEHTVFF